MPGHSDATATLQALGLTQSTVQTLSRWVTDLSALCSVDEDDEDAPSLAEKAPAALAALLGISSLDPNTQAGEGARTFLLGAEIVSLLAEVICVCDEEWILETTPTSVAVDALSQDQQTQLQLLAVALDALGSLCTFAPAVETILEEDYLPEGLETQLVRDMAKAMTLLSPRGAFSPQSLTPSSRICRYPLLLAVCFFSFSPAFAASLRGSAMFALSWLLSNADVAAMAKDIGVDAGIFAVLASQTPLRDLSHALLTPDASTQPSDDVAEHTAERFSASQENVRLYACIALQRFSSPPGGAASLFRAPKALFAVSSFSSSSSSSTSSELSEEGMRRLNLILYLLRTVPSFNLRAILLNVLLSAVSSPATSGATAPSSNGFSIPSAQTSPLRLPASCLAALQGFRSNCGSIGSSRRTSPALGAISVAVAGQRTPSALVLPSSVSTSGPTIPRSAITDAQTADGSSEGASATTSSALPSSSSSAASALPPPVPQPPSSRASPTEAEEDAGEEAEEEVGELSRDIEQAVDKTATLQALVSRILEAQPMQTAPQE